MNGDEINQNSVQTDPGTTTTDDTTSTTTDVVESPDEKLQVDIETESANTVDTTQHVTPFETPKGTVTVVHDVTFGDLIISTLLGAILIFMFLDRVIRR